MHYILMADIMKSSSKGGKQLMSEFERLVKSCNRNFASQILSPLTITLGDEFQRVVKFLVPCVEIVLYLEEQLLKQNLDFRLRYAINYGAIDTPINTKYAHGMLGSGLTQARKRLNQMKSIQERHWTNPPKKGLGAKLNRAFLIYQTIYDEWTGDDIPMASAFLRYKNYKKVAQELGKDPSSVWRRERSLKIKAYQATKELIRLLAEEEK